MNSERVLIIENMREELCHPKVRSGFMDILSLRQETFSELYENALMLAPQDLIATHIILYQGDDCVGAIRLVSSRRCRENQIPFPLDFIAETGDDLQKHSYRKFEEEVGDMMNMGFLCVHRNFRSKAYAQKYAAMLIWLAMRWSHELGQHNHACAINQHLKIDRWLAATGEWKKLNPLVHPTIPHLHDLLLVHPLREEYLPWGESQWGAIWKNIQVIGAIPQRREEEEAVAA